MKPRNLSASSVTLSCIEFFDEKSWNQDFWFKLATADGDATRAQVTIKASAALSPLGSVCKFPPPGEVRHRCLLEASGNSVKKNGAPFKKVVFALNLKLSCTLCDSSDFFSFFFYTHSDTKTQFGWTEEFCLTVFSLNTHKSWREATEPQHRWTPPLSHMLRGCEGPERHLNSRRGGGGFTRTPAGVFPQLRHLDWPDDAEVTCEKKKESVTLRACSLACSSSSACCFSFSSIRLNDIPVEEREETALDRVDALRDNTRLNHSHS